VLADAKRIVRPVGLVVENRRQFLVETRQGKCIDAAPPEALGECGIQVVVVDEPDDEPDDEPVADADGVVPGVAVADGLKVATNGVRAATEQDRELLDVLTAIRHHVPLDLAGRLLAALCLVAVPSLSAAEIIEADVCIYGGTAGGVAAEVQAARMGKTAVIAEFGNHLGGLTSGGLGATDIGNKAAIGGIAREFYHRIALHYADGNAWRFEQREEYFAHRGGNSTASELSGTDATMWTFEPHVAEDILFQMANEAKVAVYFQQRLASVKKEGGRIAEIVMRAIPYPMLLVFVLGDRMQVWAAHQKISQSDSSKNTLEEFIISEWVTAESQLFAALNIKVMRFNNYFALYTDIVDAISIFNAKQRTGNDAELTGETARQLVTELDALDLQIVNLRSELKKETQFNRKVEMNIIIKRIESEKNIILKEIN